MDTDEPDVTEPTSETPVAAPSAGASNAETEATIMHRDIAEWHGMELVDRDGERIGKLEEIYVDVETDEPQFGTVKEGFFGRHLTFVPLIGITIGPDNLQIAATRTKSRTPPRSRCEARSSTRPTSPPSTTTTSSTTRRPTLRAVAASPAAARSVGAASLPRQR